MPEPISTGAAILGGSIIGGGLSAMGASDAASTQAGAADRSAALQKEIFDLQRAGQEPYRQAGLISQNRLMELLGIGGTPGAADYGKYGRNFNMSDFEQDPSYAFRLSEGQKALDRHRGLISGGALKAAQRYGQDMASQEYTNAFNRYQTQRTNRLQSLGNLMASGQSAASNQGQAAGNYGTNAGQAYMAGGQATAAGQLGVGNTINNALGTMASSYQNQNNFDKYLANQLARNTSSQGQRINPMSGEYMGSLEF